MSYVCCAHFIAFRPVTLLNIAQGIKGKNQQYSAQCIVTKGNEKAKGEFTLPTLGVLDLSALASTQDVN
jgi:hypothetical protein